MTNLFKIELGILQNCTMSESLCNIVKNARKWTNMIVFQNKAENET